jgi:hypothetical protein
VKIFDFLFSTLKISDVGSEGHLGGLLKTNIPFGVFILRQDSFRKNSKRGPKGWQKGSYLIMTNREARAFAWNSGAIVGFGAIQVFSMFARVWLSMVVDQGALERTLKRLKSLNRSFPLVPYIYQLFHLVHSALLNNFILVSEGSPRLYCSSTIEINRTIEKVQ